MASAALLHVKFINAVQKAQTQTQSVNLNALKHLLFPPDKRSEVCLAFRCDRPSWALPPSGNIPECGRWTRLGHTAAVARIPGADPSPQTFLSTAMVLWSWSRVSNLMHWWLNPVNLYPINMPIIGIFLFKYRFFFFFCHLSIFSWIRF